MLAGLGEIEPRYVAERLLQAAVLLLVDRNCGAEPPVEVGRKRCVAQVGQPLAGALDVVVDTEDLLDHDNARPGFRLGQR